jgi:hypothetical protein
LDNNGRTKPDDLLDKEDLRTLREFAFDKKDSDEILDEALNRIEEGEYVPYSSCFVLSCYYCLFSYFSFLFLS